jgi:hypothetical protein
MGTKQVQVAERLRFGSMTTCFSARVSTDDRTTALHIDALKEAGRQAIFKDNGSSGLDAVVSGALDGTNHAACRRTGFS